MAWHRHEHREDVDERHKAPVRGVEAEQAGCFDGHLAHHGHREPDQDSNDVEEQVHEGDLQAFLLHDSQGRQHACHRGADVGPQCHWKHLGNGKHANTAERRQSASCHGGGLDDDGDTKSDQQCHIVVHVGGPHDNLLRRAHDQGVQKLHQDEKGSANDDQREDQPNNSTSRVSHAGKGAFIQDSATLNGLSVELVRLEVATGAVGATEAARNQAFISGLVHLRGMRD